jgi:hypothetical protein
MAFLATLLLFIVFQVHDQPLHPYTIISLELAGTPENAGEMFAVWGAPGQQIARESLWIDFAFMPAYTGLFAGLALTEARLARGRWQTAGLWLALLPFGSWGVDVIENLQLLSVLQNPAAPAAAPLTLAQLAAQIKFALLLICLAYILAAWLKRRPLVETGK